MARQVYFDPFGMRTTGYRQGVQDEISLQDQTRRARNSDWNYENIFPLEQRAMQRADTLGQASLPYQIRSLPRQERAQEASLYSMLDPINRELGIRLGDWTPQVRADLQFAGITPQRRMGETFTDGVDANGNPMTYTEYIPYLQGTDIYGNPYDFGAPNVQSYEALGLRQMAMQDQEAELRATEGAIRQQQAYAQMMQMYEEMARRQQQQQIIRQLAEQGFIVSPISGQIIDARGGAGGSTMGIPSDGY